MGGEEGQGETLANGLIVYIGMGCGQGVSGRGRSEEKNLFNAKETK